MDPDDAPMSDHPRIVAVLFYRERVMDLLFCPSSLTYQRQISETPFRKFPAILSSAIHIPPLITPQRIDRVQLRSPVRGHIPEDQPDPHGYAKGDQHRRRRGRGLDPDQSSGQGGDGGAQ